MLPDGFPLSLPRSDSRYRDIGLAVSDERLEALDLWAYGTEYKPPLEEKYGPWKWQRQVRLRMWYRDGDSWAAQSIGIRGHSSNGRSLDRPIVSRSIISPVDRTSWRSEHHELHTGVERLVADENDILELLGYIGGLTGTALQQAA